MRNKMAVVCLAPLLAAVPMSATLRKWRYQAVRINTCSIWVGVQYQPKYPGSKDYILVPFPLIAVQRFFLPGFGQVADGEEKLRAFYMYPSFDFNGKREASTQANSQGPKP